LDPQVQANLTCDHCGEVTLADGSKVWVCKSCGQPNEPLMAPAETAAVPVETPAMPQIPPMPQMPPMEPVVPAEPVAAPGIDTTKGV